MVLFGPPGTSKTTIIKALSKKLDWPLVYITPSLFLSKGINSIDSEANKVFSFLFKIKRAIIFFDECDELFRNRDDVKAKEGLNIPALITGAMLPRLQDLHDRGGLILVMATNRINKIDKAILRMGRFDYIYPVGPPDEDCRKIIIEEKLISELTSCSNEILSTTIDRTTIPELIDIINKINSFYPEISSLALVDQQDKLKNKTKELIVENELTIGQEDMEEFKRNVLKYKRV